MSRIDSLNVALAGVAILLAVVAIVLAFYTIQQGCHQAAQARHIALSIYATFDRITRRVTEIPILEHGEGHPCATTSVSPRVGQHDMKVTLALGWNDLPGQPRFYPEENDTVLCSVLTPGGTNFAKKFAGREKDRVQYVFPDDFNGPHEMEAGPYEVRWEPPHGPDDLVLYGYDTFFVAPS